MSSQLPHNWSYNNLDESGVDILDGDRGKEYPKESDFYDNEYCLFLSAKNVTKTGFKFSQKAFITSEKDKKLRKGRLLFGDIIITTRGTVGNIAFFDKSVPFRNIRINSGMAIIRNVDNLIDTLFLNQLLHSSLINDQLELLTSGSAQPQLTIGVVKSLSIPTPPLPEQQKIAKILTSVDEVIEKTQAQIDKLKDLKTGMMQELLTKGIGQGGVPHTEFKDSPVGRIPVGWEVFSIGNLLEKGVIETIQDGNHGAIHPKSADFTKQGIPFVMASNIHNGEIDFENVNRIPEHIYQGLRIGFAKPSDVLLSHKATVGLTAVVPPEAEKIMLTPQVTYYRIGDTKKLLNWYLHYYFQSSVFQAMISILSAQSTRSYIGILAQRELLISLPSCIDEQEKIVSVLKTMDTKLKVLEKKLASIKNTKKALMQDLLTGKVRVKVDKETAIN